MACLLHLSMLILGGLLPLVKAQDPAPQDPNNHFIWPPLPGERANVDPSVFDNNPTLEAGVPQVRPFTWVTTEQNFRVYMIQEQRPSVSRQHILSDCLKGNSFNQTTLLYWDGNIGDIDLEVGNIVYLGLYSCNLADPGFRFFFSHYFNLKPSAKPESESSSTTISTVPPTASATAATTTTALTAPATTTTSAPPKTQDSDSNASSSSSPSSHAIALGAGIGGGVGGAIIIVAAAFCLWRLRRRRRRQREESWRDHQHCPAESYHNNNNDSVFGGSEHHGTTHYPPPPPPLTLPSYDTRYNGHHPHGSNDINNEKAEHNINTMHPYHIRNNWTSSSSPPPQTQSYSQQPLPIELPAEHRGRSYPAEL